MESPSNWTWTPYQLRPKSYATSTFNANPLSPRKWCFYYLHEKVKIEKFRRSNEDIAYFLVSPRMKRSGPWGKAAADIISIDDEAEDSVNQVTKNLVTPDGIDSFGDEVTNHLSPHDLLMRKAEMYQEYMSKIPLPTERGSLIPFSSWIGLGKSIKQLYGQPLHYLTNTQLKQWDQLRFGCSDEQRPLDTIIHPHKAEATVWLLEEIHRHTSTHLRIAKLWQLDPVYYVSVDSIPPALLSSSQ